MVLPDGIERDVFVVDGTFSFEGADDAETVISDAYLVPGLVDAHAHLQLWSPAGDDASLEERVQASAQAQLDAGVLVLREPGGPEGSAPGVGPAHGLPRTASAGRFLTPPGTYVPGYGRPTPEGELADAAEAEVRASGAWAKVIGDFPNPPEGRRQPHYSFQALAEAARRVHGAGGRIAIHASHPDVIAAAIEARFDSIEHATALRHEHVVALEGSETVIVPTLMIEQPLADLLRRIGVPQSEFDAVMADFGRLPGVLRDAADAGVTILAGTDAGMVPHGRIADEVRLLLKAGLPPADALGAASWKARSYLGHPGIEGGAPADLVAYRSDPREDPEVLLDPAVIIFDGVRVR